MNAQNDVIIIGAGFAGLTAAKSLLDHGLNIKVLEARSQAGGRVESTTLNSGERVDIGGTWITPIQTEILNLARNYGVETIMLPVEGKDLGDLETSVTHPELADIISQLDEMTYAINTRKPWTAPRATEWDRQSFAGWLEKNISNSDVKRFLSGMLGEYFLCGAENISLLHTLFYWKSNGGFEYIFGESGQSSRQLRCDGSVHQLCLRMSEEIGERIMLNCPVRRITQFKNRTTVCIDSGEFSAARILIAMSPTSADHITFEPALSPMRTYLAQCLMKSSLFAFKVVYEEPFWRDKGFSGSGLFYAEGIETVDTSPKHGANGIITAYSCPHAFWRLVTMGQDERKQTVLNILSKYFGDTAATPQQYIEKTTVFDPMILGCVTAFAPNTWSTVGSTIREPSGNIHWAGTETATEFAGQMEGAIRSGRRAAEEIFVALTQH